MGENIFMSETIKIKCPLCEKEMENITSKMPSILKMVANMAFSCNCENVILLLQKKKR